MSQEDCLEVLKKNRRWMNTVEISKKIGVGRNSTNNNLWKLWKQELTEHKRAKVKNQNSWNNFWRLK